MYCVCVCVNACPDDRGHFLCMHVGRTERGFPLASPKNVSSRYKLKWRQVQTQNLALRTSRDWVVKDLSVYFNKAQMYNVYSIGRYNSTVSSICVFWPQ